MRMLLLLSSILIVAGLLDGSSALAADNLLNNGALLVNAKGQPAPWKTEGIQILSADKDEKPEGAEQSLKVEIIKEAANYGQVWQQIKTGPNTLYLLQVDLKSSKNRLGLCQVKLYKDNRELRRIDLEKAGTDWKTVSLEFSSEDADTIMVLLRYPQDAKSVGEIAWFANVKLTRADAVSTP